MRGQRGIINVETGAQPFFKPHPFNVEIELQCLNLLRQCHLTARFCHQRVAQKAGQPRQHRIGGFGLFQQHQRADRIQGVEQEMRVQLIAQHGQLRGGGLRLQPFEPVGLLFHCQEEIDRIIQGAPPAEQGERQVKQADDPLGKGRLTAGGVIDALHPGIDRRMQHHRHKQHQRRDAPSDEGLLADQLAIDHRQDQADRKAGDGGDQNQREDIEWLAIGHRRYRAQHECPAPTRQLEVPERPVLACKERRCLDLEHCHSRAGLTHFAANDTAFRRCHRWHSTGYRFGCGARPPAGSISRRK